MDNKTAIRLRAKMQKAVKLLSSVVSEARQAYPNACLYLEAEGNLHLLSGPSHDDSTFIGTARRDRNLVDVSTRHVNLDAGVW